jgi:membrane-bound lytic murein transglycosylase B
MKRIVLILLCLILSVGCFPCFSEASPNNAGISKTPWHDPVWDSLYKRLLKDGFSQKQLDKYFVQLENGFSQKPMGNKVKELYTASFVPKKKPVKEKGKEKPKTNKLGIPYPWYDGYVTDANAVKCLNFLKENEEYFALAEKKYAVPREVISALIYVETWHGKFLGKFNPLPMLASMSISTDLAMLPNYTAKLNLTQKQKDYLQEKIKIKADWAYNELKALLNYAIKNKIDINTVPSSIYGAIGYGQFMPSNIPLYGIDGNKDGKIDVFEPADAILSVAKFLHAQGWKQKNIDFNKQVKVIKRYNHSTAYAHTILALAKLSKQTSLPEKEKSSLTVSQENTEKNNATN